MKIERIDPQAHIGELVELAKVEYGDAEIADPDYLRWQYVENPAGEAIVVVARAENGELAGQYVVIPLEFRLDGEIVKGSLSLNTLTHPAYRGMGLFTKMANETYAVCEREGLALTLGFPNKSSYPGFVRKLQFQHIGNATVMFRPLRPLMLLARLPALRSAPKYALSELPAFSGQFPNEPRGFTVGELCFASNAEAYDGLIASQLNPRFCVYKGARFCRWRYVKIPSRQYQAFHASAGAKMLAACVVRQRKVKGLECVFIVDVQMGSDPQAKAAAGALLKSVLSFYRARGVCLAGIMVNKGTTVYHIARSLWFRTMPSRLMPHDAPIIIRRNGSVLNESVFDIGDWEFVFGDYDVF